MRLTPPVVLERSPAEAVWGKGRGSARAWIGVLDAVAELTGSDDEVEGIYRDEADEDGLGRGDENAVSFLSLDAGPSKTETYPSNELGDRSLARVLERLGPAGRPTRMREGSAGASCANR